MEEYIVNYYPVAKDDIKDIYSSLLENEVSENVARRQVDSIVKTLETLNMFPERHVKVDQGIWKNHNLHKMPINNYVAFYTVDKLNHIVTVVRILYQGRNLDYILEKNQLLVCEKNVL